MAPKIYGIPCKLSKLVVISLIFISQQYKDHQWFQVLLIIEHNSFTIINIEFFAML